MLQPPVFPGSLVSLFLSLYLPLDLPGLQCIST